MMDFTCQADQRYLSACRNLPEYRGTGYCVLHYPDESKDKNEFKRVLNDKLDTHNFDFRGVWFPSTWIGFSPYKFDRNVDFTGATFQCAAFDGATFEGEVVFTKAIFYATFEAEERTDFRRVTFKELAYFKESRFTGYTDFYRANFFNAARFVGAADASGKESKQLFSPAGRVSFNRALIQKPELFSFDTVTLHTSWFVGVDTREVRFNSVQWYGLPGAPEGDIEEEISTLAIPKWARHSEQEGWKLLEKTCRELCINAEENREYPLANEFHYWSMEAQRKALPKSDFAPSKLIWWYWALSGYSERQVRAAVWLLGILFGFAVLYLLVGPVEMKEYSLGSFVRAVLESLVYSLGVMTRLSNVIPDTASQSQLVRALIIIEGVVGPFQIGVFLFALRREFMR